MALGRRRALAVSAALALCLALVASSGARPSPARVVSVSEVMAAVPGGTVTRSGSRLTATASWPNIAVLTGNATKYATVSVRTTIAPTAAPRHAAARPYTFVSTLVITVPGLGRTTATVVGAGKPRCTASCDDDGTLRAKPGGARDGTFSLSFDTKGATLYLALDNVRVTIG